MEEFSIFDESETELPTTVVDDNTEKDTKTVNIEVTPGMNNIISKVHIVIPALKYDHEYTTHIELESVIPTIEDPEPTTPQEQPKQNDTTQDQQPATDKTESSTPEKPSTSVSNTETQKQDTKVDAQSKQDETSKNQQPATDKTESSTPEKPTTSVNNTETQKQDVKAETPSETGKKTTIKLKNLQQLKLTLLLNKTNRLLTLQKRIERIKKTNNLKR